MLPDTRGYFGAYGGRFVPETLMSALDELAAAYKKVKDDPGFQQTLAALLKDYVGRPSPLYRARNFARHCGNARVYLKREDLNHTGAHKINNTLGQALLAVRMGKSRVIAETGAGQHGVATATAAALLGLSCTVFMGEEDIARQELNVFRMRILGAEVIPVGSGNRTLKDAMNEAMREWVASVDDTFYIIGSVAGPHPYPMMVRDFQAVIGEETRAQVLEAEGRLPDFVIACVGGGSNSIGIFKAFVPEKDVELVAVEAGGRGPDIGENAATLNLGRPGVLHGSYSYVLQDGHGQIAPVHSVSAGLDYPGVGPELAYLKDSGRLRSTMASDSEALDAFLLLCRTEGIIPALESAHAFAGTLKLTDRLDSDRIVVINVSGRGDKDVESVSKILKGVMV